MRLRPVLCLASIAAFLTSLILSAAGIHGGSTATAATGGAFPAGMSANHRYLVDQNGQPYLIVGDSPHSIFVNTSPADADFYLADRQAHGINAIWVEALSNGYTGGRAGRRTTGSSPSPRPATSRPPTRPTGRGSTRSSRRRPTTTSPRSLTRWTWPVGPQR